MIRSVPPHDEAIMVNTIRSRCMESMYIHTYVRYIMCIAIGTSFCPFSLYVSFDCVAWFLICNLFPILHQFYTVPLQGSLLKSDSLLNNALSPVVFSKVLF